MVAVRCVRLGILAAAWLEELRAGDPVDDREVGQLVVMMNFTATGDQQWQFILAAVSRVTYDEELGQIAAGPIEHLLGWHGAEFNERVEQHAKEDSKFARALTGVWQYLMGAEVWSGIRAFQEQVSDPLKPNSDSPP